MLNLRRIKNIKEGLLLQASVLCDLKCKKQKWNWVLWPVIKMQILFLKILNLKTSKRSSMDVLSRLALIKEVVWELKMTSNVHVHQAQHIYQNSKDRTLYNIILRIARNFLETRKNFKILTHPFYHTNLDWFSWEWSKKNFFLRKDSKWLTQTTTTTKSWAIFAKILQVGFSVNRIDWCEGH